MRGRREWMAYEDAANDLRTVCDEQSDVASDAENGEEGDDG
jgi:hypothetical protein